MSDTTASKADVNADVMEGLQAARARTAELQALTSALTSRTEAGRGCGRAITVLAG